MNILLLGAGVQMKEQQCHVVRKELIKMIVKEGHVLTVMGKVPQKLCDAALNHLGAKYSQVELNSSIINPFQQVKVFRSVGEVFKRIKPHMFIAYSVKHIPTTVMAAKIAKIHQINVIINGSGRLFQRKGVKGAVLRACLLPVLRHCLLSCEHVFFQNRDDQHMFIDMKLISPDKAVHVNGSGVNTESFERAPLPENTTFLMVARLLKEKGVMEYLEAARIVKSTYPEARFLLAGALDASEAGVKKEDLHRYIADQTVEYAGEVSNIKDYYKECSVFVLPSYYREGIPRTVLEAMATGRPILTTDSPGCKETVEDGVNGYLIPPRNVHALVKKMIWMIEHRDQMERMGQQSREICERKFDVHKVNEKMLLKMGLK